MHLWFAEPVKEQTERACEKVFKKKVGGTQGPVCNAC